MKKIFLAIILSLSYAANSQLPSMQGITDVANITPSEAEDIILDPFTPGMKVNSLDINAKVHSLDMKISRRTVVYLKDVRPDGVNGGDFESGAWRQRVLNTVEGESSMVSLENNQFELQAGKYDIEIEAPVRGVINTTQVKLRNISSSSDAILGTSMVFGAADDYGNCTAKGIVTISSPTVFEVQHQAQTSKSVHGFGMATTFVAGNEVYTVVKITKLE